MRFQVSFLERDLYGERILNAPVSVPLLSRMRGNAMPETPVIASMSDSVSCNQGGTVEYKFVSHP